MGTLYLVRHGQASFGADDYDQLSPLGQRQCTRLGEYFRERGQDFDASYTGTLKRQQQSLQGVQQGYGHALPAPTELPGLNEYDSHAVVHAIHPEPLGKADTPETYRQHFRLLREGLAAWMEGRSAPQGMPRYADFVAGVADALDRVRSGTAEKVLLVSSGGPISTALGQVLGLAPPVTIELNMRIRNSSVTEFAFTPKRHMLVTYNTLPHLDAPAYADWVTYA
ncbi:fructose-2,6-bisphosphatase [Burkholderiales bacterium JOSHI_001]|nr:fructose-2,6-bisphosphatase [Burkholderiales bacterium JOSHI_001]